MRTNHSHKTESFLSSVRLPMIGAPSLNVEPSDATPKRAPREAFGPRGLNRQPVRLVPVTLAVNEPLVL